MVTHGDGKPKGKIIYIISIIWGWSKNSTNPIGYKILVNVPGNYMVGIIDVLFSLFAKKSNKSLRGNSRGFQGELAPFTEIGGLEVMLVNVWWPRSISRVDLLAISSIFNCDFILTCDHCPDIMT